MTFGKGGDPKASPAAAIILAALPGCGRALTHTRESSPAPVDAARESQLQAQYLSALIAREPRYSRSEFWEMT